MNSTTDTRNLLVGADGIRSAVRAQRAPAARTQDTGVRAVYGRLPMSAARQLVPDHVLSDVFTVAVDLTTLFLGLGPVVFPIPPDRAARQVLPQAALLARAAYLVCIVGGRQELFADYDAALLAHSSRQLQQVWLDLTSQWPETTRADLSAADPEAFFAVQMYAGVPSELPPSDRVTLLGDTVHAMTPTLGRHLQDVVDGRQALPHAIADYEAQMTSYGFAVVRESAATGARLVGQNPLP